MPQDTSTHRRIVLAARPHGLPTTQDFRLDHAPLPSPGEGEVLLRTLYLSLDPYMRNLMDEAGTEYAPGLELGQPMMGGTVSRVVSSRHAGFQPGELVLGSAGWQDYAVAAGDMLTTLGDLAQPSLALGGLALQVAEVAWLHARWGTNMAQDFVVGTYFYGLGVAMLALSDPAPLRFPRLAGLGPLVLGIYASHNLFVDPLAGPDNPMRAVPGWDVIVVAVVFALALGLTALLARFPLTRRLVA